MQTKLLQVQSELTTVNAQIEEKKTELDDAKQEVNELDPFRTTDRDCEFARTATKTMKNIRIRRKLSMK